jgi:hypothetical protein
VTASLSNDSPNTTMLRTSSTHSSSNKANTATGSTAEIKAPNNRAGRSFRLSSSKIPVFPTRYREPPVTITGRQTKECQT